MQNGDTSFGFGIRDENGIIKLCGVNSLDSSSSIFVAEAWVSREGVKGVMSLGVRNLVIEGDNFSVIQAIKTIRKIPLDN